MPKDKDTGDDKKDKLASASASSSTGAKPLENSAGSGDKGDKKAGADGTAEGTSPAKPIVHQSAEHKRISDAVYANRGQMFGGFQERGIADLIAGYAESTEKRIALVCYPPERLSDATQLKLHNDMFHVFERMLNDKLSSLAMNVSLVRIFPDDLKKLQDSSKDRSEFFHHVVFVQALFLTGVYNKVSRDEIQAKLNTIFTILTVDDNRKFQVVLIRNVRKQNELKDSKFTALKGFVAFKSHDFKFVTDRNTVEDMINACPENPVCIQRIAEEIRAILFPAPAPVSAPPSDRDETAKPDKP